MTENRPRLSRRKRLLFAFALVLFPLLALELFFRLTGHFAPDKPFSIVRDDRGVELMQYNWNQLKPRFAPEKSPGTLRIMVFGESSAAGFPYLPKSSFGEMLRVMLEQVLPGTRVELINLGRVGMNSAEVADLMPRALEYTPDLVIIYSGHNEFVSLRNPASFAALLSRRLGSIRVARAGGTGLKAGIGALTMAVQESIEEEALAPPPPDRVSPRDFNLVLTRYRHNLERMAAECQRRKIPVVLNTLAANLAGWPPESRVFPPGVSEENQTAAAAAVTQAENIYARVILGQAPLPPDTNFLTNAGRKAPGYAPISYWRALLGGAAPDDDLLAALSHEAHTVTVHRAPPELNEVIPAVATENQLWLADNRGLSFTPTLFDDHCHPTLSGQRQIAANIFSVLKKNNFWRPAVEWLPVEWEQDVPASDTRPRPGWDMDGYLRSRQIDAVFLHDLRLRMGIFLGLERSLPAHSELTRRQLDEAIATDRSDPLPALLLAAVFLHYGDRDGAAAALAPWARRQDRLRLAIDRYFTRAVDLRDGVMLFHLEPDPELPPLRGLLTSGIIDQSKPRRRVTDPKPREYYNVTIKLQE